MIPTRTMTADSMIMWKMLIPSIALASDKKICKLGKIKRSHILDIGIPLFPIDKLVSTIEKILIKITTPVISIQAKETSSLEKSSPFWETGSVCIR